mmetsp:Transcript_73472/g.226824  ORF Transcript_73472/g.226824 Transcript_73472/m.226824 type:complete len:303 (-) Transcript_73472:61-969(-)
MGTVAASIRGDETTLATAFAALAEGPRPVLVMSKEMPLWAAPELAPGLLRLLLQRRRVKSWSFEALWDDALERLSLRPAPTAAGASAFACGGAGDGVPHGTVPQRLLSQRLLEEGIASLASYGRFFRRQVRPQLGRLLEAHGGAAEGPPMASEPWRVHVKLMLRWQDLGESFVIAPSWHQDFKGGPSASVLWYFLQPQDHRGHLEFTLAPPAVGAGRDALAELPADTPACGRLPLDRPQLVAFHRGAPSPGAGLWHRTGPWERRPGALAGGGGAGCCPGGGWRGVRGILSFVVWLPGDPETC